MVYSNKFTKYPDWECLKNAKQKVNLNASWDCDQLLSRVNEIICAGGKGQPVMTEILSDDEGKRSAINDALISSR